MLLAFGDETLHWGQEHPNYATPGFHNEMAEIARRTIKGAARERNWDGRVG